MGRIKQTLIYDLRTNEYVIKDIVPGNVSYNDIIGISV